MLTYRSSIRVFIHCIIVSLCTVGVLVSGKAHAAALVVTNNLDSGPGSLRAAILTANSNGQADTITFSVAPVYSLTLGNSLPPITAGNLTIDGSGTTAIVTGSTTPARTAFFFNAVSGCTIRNLTVAGAQYGVRFSGGSGNVAEGLSLSSNRWAAYFEDTSSNTLRGSTITSNTNSIHLVGATNCTVGGTTPSTSNRIAGHTDAGILITNNTLTSVVSANNIIIGNRIGLNAAGTAAQSNLYGIHVVQSAGTRIGGIAAGEANVISGNTYGIRLRGINCINTQVQGNRIGVADDGVTIIGNTFYGISIEASANQNVVGGPTAAHSNVIKGNGLSGIFVTGASSARNTIQRNSIFQNTTTGITLASSANNSIAPPSLTSPNPIVGTAVAAGTLQFYVDNASQGETFVVESLSHPGGAFSVSTDLSLYEGKNLTATITNSLGSTSAFSAPILIDVTPPIGGIAADDPIVIDENALLLITAPTDNFTSTANIDMRFSNDGITWSAWEPYAATKAWDLNFGITPFGGVHTVSVQFRDDSLNVSASYTTNVEIDITPPDGGLFISDPVYTSPFITLDLIPEPTDNNSLLAGIEMRFSNDAINWTAWESYVSTKVWDLNQDLLDTSDGNRLVLLQLRDEAGNVSSTYSDNTELDTTGPVVTDISLLDPEVSDLDSVRIQITFNEALLGFDTGMNPNSDDVSLNVNGLTGTFISEIVANGLFTYTVLIETGSGDGTIELELASTNLTDDHGNAFIGSETSDQYVIDRLRVTLGPVGGEPIEDDPYGFGVATAGGIGTLHYSWLKDGNPIPDAPDAPVYNIPFLELSDTGSYSCVISDDYIDVTTASAQLDVQIRIPLASSAGLALLTALLAVAFLWFTNRRMGAEE